MKKTGLFALLFCCFFSFEKASAIVGHAAQLVDTARLMPKSTAQKSIAEPSATAFPADRLARAALWVSILSILGFFVFPDLGVAFFLGLLLGFGLGLAALRRRTIHRRAAKFAVGMGLFAMIVYALFVIGVVLSEAFF